MDVAQLCAGVDVLLECGEIDAAREACTAFIARSPADLGAYRTLGTVLEAAGDKAGAIECYRGQLPAALEAMAFTLPDDADPAADVGDVTYLEAHSPERRAVRSPVAATTPALAQWGATTLTSLATGTVVVDKGSLWHDGFNTVAFDARGRIVREALIGNAGPVVSSLGGRAPVRFAGDVVLLGSRGSMNYFHWMSDMLPKIAVLERSGIDWRAATFVVPNLILPFQKETLQMLGIDAARVHQSRVEGECVAADRLLIPQMSNNMCTTMGSWVSPFLRERFGGTRSRARDRKLLVSRDPSASHGRGLANIAQVNDFYADLGYEIVVPDRHSVREQFALFAAASHVAGPHGAGLTNLHFCEPGTEVIEFYGDHLAPCYWAISELADLHYLNCGERGDTLVNDPLAAARSIDARRSRGFEVSIAALRDLHGTGQGSAEEHAA